MSNIVWFDIETTGLSIINDRIIEIYMIKTDLDGNEIDSYYSLIYPGDDIEITPGAYEKHNISKVFLTGQKLFKEVANEIIEFIGDSDLGGYNITRFDIPFLVEEFLREGIVFTYRNRNIIDPFLIYSKYEPRTLESAYKKYTGKELDGAHQAKNDVNATIEIFQAQLELYNMPKDIKLINEKINDFRKTQVDLGGKLKIEEKSDKKEIVFTFGKWSGVSVKEVYSKDPSYIDWIINKSDFPKETKLILNKIIQTF